MRRAKLSHAVMREAKMSDAILSYADLEYADLTGACIDRAVFKMAVLDSANMTKAYMPWADLSKATLICANLSSADLRHVVFKDTNLSYANLNGTNMTGASFVRTKIVGAEGIEYIPFVCPKYGSFYGWKKASGKIVCLEIPADAKRVSGADRTCRCNKAKVISITNEDGSPSDVTKVKSDYDCGFCYKVGEVVYADPFDVNRWHASAPGIHFYTSRIEAVEHMMISHITVF